MNLLSNSLKFTNKGEIKILVTLEKNILKISVSDTGCGIKDETKKNIFNNLILNQHISSGIFATNDCTAV